jgi:putative endonuclease
VDHRALGDVGEDVAAAWYVARDYRVVARNWRCSDGEIDLLVARGGELVVCEVKTRRGNGFGAPFEAVTAAKQRRIRRLAARWLAEQVGVRPDTVRFDVASVLARRGFRPEIEVLEGVF